MRANELRWSSQHEGGCWGFGMEQSGHMPMVVAQWSHRNTPHPPQPMGDKRCGKPTPCKGHLHPSCPQEILLQRRSLVASAANHIEAKSSNFTLF